MQGYQLGFRLGLIHVLFEERSMVHVIRLGMGQGLARVKPGEELVLDIFGLCNWVGFWVIYRCFRLWNWV